MHFIRLTNANIRGLKVCMLLWTSHVRYFLLCYSGQADLHYSMSKVMYIDILSLVSHKLPLVLVKNFILEIWLQTSSSVLLLDTKDDALA